MSDKPSKSFFLFDGGCGCWFMAAICLLAAAIGFFAPLLIRIKDAFK